MAKGCNALGGSFRGRVGNATYYVRHGQQIVYERVPRQEHRHVERRPGSPASMKYAQRWRKQLEDEGVVVELASVLEFYHSIVRVADGDPGEWLADSGRGGWSAGNVSVVNGEVRAKALARDQSLWREGYLLWGDNEIKGAIIPNNCWYDANHNVYPAGSLFCSVRGDMEGELELVIGKRNNMPSKYRQLQRIQTRFPIIAAYYNGTNVISASNQAAMPKPFDYIYDVQGWQAPSVQGMAAVAYPFFIVNAEGVMLEMAVLN